MSIDGKALIPWGNTFDYADPVTLTPLFDYKPAATGQAVYRNRASVPVDPVNNPQGIGYMADLLQGSDDPLMMASHPGLNITYKIPSPLVAGNTYTVSCWFKPAFLGGQSAQILLLGSGNWTTGIQTPGCEGDFSDPSWKFINGHVDIVQAAITGTYGSIGDLGVPKDIPTNRRLFSRHGDHIRSVSDNGANPVWVMDPLNAHGTVYDLSTAADLTPLLLGIKNSTLFYQEVMPPAGASSLQMDAWMRIAQETVTGGVVNINPSITGNITGLALVYTDLTGRQIVQVWRSYLTISTGWRLQFNAMTTNPSYVPRDTTQPIGYGFFFTGDLAVYGGIRLQDDTTLSGTSHSLTVGAWTRVSYTFTANLPMQDTLNAQAFPGFATPLVFSAGYITITLNVSQGSQPKIPGTQTPNPAYSPWCPYWASLYLYGLWINDDSPATAYPIDGPTPVTVYGTLAEPRFKAFPSHTVVPAGQTVTVTGSFPRPREPEHNLGFNLTGNGWFSPAMPFLNLCKNSRFSRLREGIDPSGVIAPRRTCGWLMAWKSAYTFNVFDSRLPLVGVIFNDGQSYFTVPVSANGSWGKFHSDWRDRSLITGPHIPTGMKVTGAAIDGNSALVRFTVDRAFAYTSSNDPAVAASTYEIKQFPIDDFTALNLNGNGYPTTIPDDYIPYGLCYRITPIPYALSVAGVMQMNNPYLPSGRYVLKWDGDGTASFSENVFLDPPGFPVVEVSTSANRIVYEVDCSGKSSTGKELNYPWRMYTDDDYYDLATARLGFVVAITRTNPENPLRNLRIVEERYEALLDSGEIFYPEWIDRVADFKTLRFLDWSFTNNFYPFVQDINAKPNVDDISYAALFSHVPWEIIIEFCNRTMKNCWICLHPASPDDLMTWVATLFRDNLDPRLHLYLEFGNEPWNGGMTGFYFQWYAKIKNVIGDMNSPNPNWTHQEKAYAMLSQRCFTIWESVFSGPNGLLHPVNLYDDPKHKRRRIVRIASLNDGGIPNAVDTFKFAREFCTNPHGIPYDAVASNFYISLKRTEVSRQEATVAPANYEWTMDEVIPYSWRAYAAQVDGCMQLHRACMTSQYPSSAGPGAIGSFLGFDNDGEPIKPACLFYEGGWGSPGPSPYMLLTIIKMKFELDGQQHVYNIHQQFFQWWRDEVAFDDNPRNREIMTANLWETPKAWGQPDQWGITDKSNYTRQQYNTFPIPRAAAESAGGLMSVSTLGDPPAFQPSQPYCQINGQWVKLANVKIKKNGEWVPIPASELKYSAGGEWH